MSKDLKEVSRLFAEESDLKALELLYEITKDELVAILINWYNNYINEIVGYGGNCFETNEFYMYDDMIHYVYVKYGL